MNFSIFVITLLCSVCLVTAAKKQSSASLKCDNENRKKADLCADKLWFVGRNSRKYPESDQEMQKHCKQTLNLIKCAKDFTDSCAKGVQKQLANVMLYTVKMNQKTYCSKSNKREEVISFGSCGNAIREESSLCMETFLRNLGKANAVKETKHKVPHACCAFHQLKSCILKAAKNKGEADCPENKMDNFERYINAMAGNTLNLMCTDYEEDSDKCSKLPALPKDAVVSVPPSIMVGFGQLLLDL